MIIALLLPLDALFVHFIDDNDKFLDAQTSCKLNVLPRLTIILKASFEFTFPGRNNETTKVSKCRTLDHIRNVILVAWGIEDGELFRWSIELCSSYFDCLTLCFLFFGLVHHVSQPPGVTSLVLCLLFVLLNSSVVNNAHLVYHLATDC